ncbi:MAG: hypothetical protein DRP09_15290 [Candidatus Thorarchaeota archaeon]|nr:MAG: hypothetical protein DRP09_15290 [Candidatus Thorarchaeota archaeon]
MTESAEYLMQINLPDKCIGTLNTTEDGNVIVDGGLVYVSDLMEYWAKRKLEEYMKNDRRSN